MTTGPVTAVDRVASGFAAAVRREGLDVPVGSVVTCAQALAMVGFDRPESVYWAGHACFVRAPEERAAYGRAFVAFWSGARDDDVQLPPPPPSPPVEVTTPTAVPYSPREVLRHKDFAAHSAEEADEARRLLADLRLAGARRRSRRLVPTRRRRGGRPDVRATVRAALGTGGEVVRRPRRTTSDRPRKVVLLCDVSGSMEPYARPLARFLHLAVAGRTRIEAFALGTRLTRLTRELSSRDPDAALAAVAEAVVDRSGGTRLGEGLRRFNDEWGVRGAARGAVVVILSDGWDRGDPAQLAGEMARLRRVAHRIVWVNPLKATPGYEPLARGMAAALPYVDDLVAGP
jgi:uncharacterized protein with von Willebrand factor type A (vWA) domain